MTHDKAALSPTIPHDSVSEYAKSYVSFPKMLFFGPWSDVEHRAGERSHRSNAQHSAFEMSFTGGTVQWVGTRAPDQGYADVYIDGEFQATVDNYAAQPGSKMVKFEKTGIPGGRIHTLRVEVRKDRHPAATDCYQDVISVRSEGPVSYVAEITRAMAAEYDLIQSGCRTYAGPEQWSPVRNRAEAPERGVVLGAGVLRDAFERNVAYLNHCAQEPTYCDGSSWTDWLPASNHGRMLAGAAGVLRWGERREMREIVDRIVACVEAQMRDDGYYGYYPEAASYATRSSHFSERKNYDRVFWTRGMLAAGLVGNAKSYRLLRRMYDWFNVSPYLPTLLLGGNATNGLPGGPLVHLSPVGKPEDLASTMKYLDQDFWINELRNREPLCFSHYPGERPHCYLLLGLEAFVDEYRASGLPKYLEAVQGGWDIYRENYKHIGGATAICEGGGPYFPKSCYVTTGHNGELCGSVFWINLNAKLLHLFPDEEKYAAEIEESLYNVVLANMDERGYRRYHARLHGHKEQATCINNCCEVSSTGLLGSLPELIYSIAEDGLFINLFAASEITWPQNGHDLRVSMRTAFPFSPDVTIEVSPTVATALNIRLRVPAWATGDMAITVNGEPIAVGRPGTYVSLNRTWSPGDTIRCTLPIQFAARKYKGLDQIAGNLDRYALMYGPILMALQSDLDGPAGVPVLAVAPQTLPDALVREAPDHLVFKVQDHPRCRYMPYWQIADEPFTCFPIVQAREVNR